MRKFTHVLVAIFVAMVCMPLNAMDLSLDEAVEKILSESQDMKIPLQEFCINSSSIWVKARDPEHFCQILKIQKLQTISLRD